MDRLPHGSLKDDRAIWGVLAQLPHVPVYERMTEALLSGEVTGQGDWVHPLRVLGKGLSHQADPGADVDLWRRRREALRDLLDHNPGALHALRNVKPGHAMALTLASGQDATFFEPNLTLNRLRALIRLAGQRAKPDDRSSWPALMLRDPAIDAVVERSGAAAEVKAAVDAFADTVDERMLAEVRGHMSMGEEAMELLLAEPAGGGFMYYPRFFPGSLFGGPKPYAAEDKESRFAPFELGTSNRDVAIATLKERAENLDLSKWHPALVKVKNQVSLFKNSIFSRTPEAFSVQTPYPMWVRNIPQEGGRTHGYSWSAKHDLWYSEITVAEVERRPAHEYRGPAAALAAADDAKTGRRTCVCCQGLARPGALDKRIGTVRSEARERFTGRPLHRTMDGGRGDVRGHSLADVALFGRQRGSWRRASGAVVGQ
jgi:hypothetical protein